ncbi:hypothetical protein ACFGVR_22710 [Mucilaginibacter sp. AW1-3]
MKTAISKSLKKRFIISTVPYLIIMIGLVVFDAGYGLSNGLILKATAIGKHLGNQYTDVKTVNSGHFISGIEGELFWKPQTFGESLLLSTVNNKDIDFLDIIALILVAVMILYMFNSSSYSALFTKKLTKRFSFFVVTIAVLGMLADVARVEIARHYLPYITQGQFTGYDNFKVFSFTYLIYPLLMFLTLIPKKGLELQEQQDLTI